MKNLSDTYKITFENKKGFKNVTFVRAESLGSAQNYGEETFKKDFISVEKYVPNYRKQKS